MPPLDRLVAKEVVDNIELNWELRYSFDVEDVYKTVFLFERWRDAPRGAWLDDDDEMLCYRLGDTLYKYDILGGQSLCSNGNEPPLQWTQKLQLPPIPAWFDRRWDVYGGYRATLLSPLTFLSPPSTHDEKIRQVEKDLLETLRPYKSKATTDAADGRAAKRICSRIDSSYA
jgi:hypothetical protein